LRDYVVIRDFLHPIQNQQMTDYALRNIDLFLERSTRPDYPPQKGHKFVGDWDLSDVIHAVKQAIPNVLGSLRIKDFSIVGIESEVSGHFNNGFLGIHDDVFCRENRLLSYVYYFHRLPREFIGGQLLIHKPLIDECYLIEPENNTIVIFLPYLKHQVVPVLCDDFSKGRFCVNGWIS
jgi:SM-20-related protein